MKKVGERMSLRTAIIVINLDGIITFWSNNAEKILGYPTNDVIGRSASFIFNQTEIEFKKNISSFSNEKIINLNFDTKTKSEEKINLNSYIHPVHLNNEVMGFSILIHKRKESFTTLSNIMFDDKKENNLPKYINALRNPSYQKKRTFIDIRKIILANLFSGKKTINQLSMVAKINWKTVENHLNYLLGRGLVKEVYSSEYVRIFDISDKGREKVIEITKIFDKDEIMTNFEPKTKIEDHTNERIIL